MTKDRKTKDIFFGIVAIATLIVAIIGATLAYFSITTSSNEGAINAQSAVVTIQYDDGNQVTAQADKLIPASLEVVQRVYEYRFVETGTSDPESNVCLDTNNQQVCSVYRFTVSSDIKRDITATLNSEENGFTYLSYAVYDVSNGKWISLTDDDEYSQDMLKCSNSNNVDPTVPEEDDCYQIDGGTKLYTDIGSYSIFGKTLEGKNGETLTIPNNKTMTIKAEQKYDVVLFIKDRPDLNQNIDQGKKYSGTLKIEVDVEGENGAISGVVDEGNW